MDIYKILKFNNYIKNHRIKFFGLWLLSVLNKRYLAIQFDPVLACNLRCKMCYFTDNDYVKKTMKGIFSQQDLDLFAKKIFKNALKLQIGCGAEPTLFKHNLQLIEIAKKHNVPYISMVTNGNLLTTIDISNFANAGLNEFILSVHGVKKESYENFMDKGNFEKFHEVLQYISDEKTRNPKLKLRMNYTFNEDNFDELNHFFDVFGNYKIDIIQLRPIDKIGETTYNNFSLSKIEEQYFSVSENLKKECQKRKITLLYPQSITRNETVSLKVKTANDSSYLIPYTYCYVSPNYFWKDDFDWKNETFSNWKSRNNWNKLLFKNIFKPKNSLYETNRNMLNYSVSTN